MVLNILLIVKSNCIVRRDIAFVWSGSIDIVYFIFGRHDFDSSLAIIAKKMMPNTEFNLLLSLICMPLFFICICIISGTRPLILLLLFEKFK